MIVDRCLTCGTFTCAAAAVLSEGDDLSRHVQRLCSLVIILKVHLLQMLQQPDRIRNVPHRLYIHTNDRFQTLQTRIGCSKCNPAVSSKYPAVQRAHVRAQVREVRSLKAEVLAYQNNESQPQAWRMSPPS